MKIKRLLFILAILAFPVALMSGTTGKIVGRLLDAETGEPMIGANVIVEGTTLGAAADSDGYYMILNIRPGVHTMRASMIGYKNVVQKNVKVIIDLTTTIDFNMEISTLQGEEVVVYAREPAVKLDATSTTFRISSDQIEQLQIEEFADLLSLQAGVYEGHFRGGRSNEVMYIIDGIPMNDMYSGDALFELDNDMIQQVEIISGTFNAEYGQAMSGIINVVTKEGQRNFEGKVSYFSGNYFSTNTKLYNYIDKFHPTAIQNIKFNISGPVIGLGKKLTFFALGRLYKNDGWIYGQRLFVPSDLSDFSDPDNPVIVSTGDGEYVPMNPKQELTLNGKLTYRLSSHDKINIFSLYQKKDFREFDQLFKYNPEGNYQRASVDYQNSIQYNHIFSPGTFIVVNLSQMYSRYGQYVYADSHDSRYVPLSYLTSTGATGFSTGGMRMWQHRRSILTNVIKLDLTSQINKQQKIDIGISYKSYKLWLHEKYLFFDENDSLRIAPQTSSYNNAYNHYPHEIAAYIQDKIEIGEMIINAGLRYDFFNPDGVVLDQYYDTMTANRIKARSSSQISPRFGIAYPISDEGVIHFSYGHFFQVPNFEYLYVNPEFEVALIQIAGEQPPRGRFNAMGNAELKPQKTVQYELGFKQALTSDLTIELTGFNKDSRDLIGQETRNDVYGGKFWRFINTDYANTKGVTIALEQFQRHAGSFGFSIDYTYQVVTGNASDPNDEWLNQGQDPPIQGEKKRQPLDWDQTHSLNASVTTDQNGFHISVIGRLGSGTPYTRSSPRYANRIKNGERKPMTMTIDLNITKDIHLGGSTLHPYLKIYNLLDARNNKEVFNSSGSAEYAYEMNFESYIGIRTQEEYFTRPDYYYEPRRIIVGISFGL
ncbi:MAG: TonB-dependent receptor [Candidatus Marinimicrobia bacterium]|nr:TonB-dependent receptor [Candidatus Neomarinimicrobiota bacterium]